MILYHFTNADINILKIEYFGHNSYTKNDAKYNQKRLFFYDTVQPKEYHLNASDYCYKVDIKESDIYNLDTDILKLKEKYNHDIDSILEYIAKNYIGCCYDVGFLCYCVFQDIKPIEKYVYTNQAYKTIGA